MPSPLRSWEPAGRSDTILFVALLACVTTAVGYQFGFGNQTEALPIVERFRDATFLSGDFFVDAGSGFGPRFYYARLIAILSSLAPVPYVMLALTLAVNAAVAAVSHCAARDLLRADRLTGWVAATLAVCSSSFALGLVSDIRFSDFQPGSLAIPWALAGLWQALVGRPLRAALLCSCASIWQPLYGIETGALALASAAARAVLLTEPPRSIRSLARSLIPTALSGVVLGAAAWLLWALPSSTSQEPRLTTSEVVNILARFRAPHHYLPSTFPAEHYLGFAAFLLASAITFHRFWRQGGRRTDLAYLVAPALVIFGCVLGYWFVEVHPSQTITTAQPFRLLYLVKWQGFLLAAWLITRLWRASDASDRRLSLATLAASAGGQPFNFLIAAAATTHGLRASRAARIALECAAVAVVLLLGKRIELCLLGCAAILLLLLARASTQAYRMAAVGFTATTLMVLAANHAWRFSNARELSPVLTFDDHQADDAEVARWVRDHTEHATFVIPPGLGAFRLIAARPVVVDFKSLPFGASAMRGWYQRMQLLYGPVDAGGFPGLRQMDANYAKIEDAKLTIIKDKFGARYAVLYAGTSTTRAPIYRNQKFQVVEL